MSNWRGTPSPRRGGGWGERSSLPVGPENARCKVRYTRARRPEVRDAQDGGGPMEYRTLGKTGERVSALSIGGAHAARPKDPEETTRIIRTAIDGGINFLDNCWDYAGGEAEVRMGHALRDGYRERVFLMTKIDGHIAAAAAAQIDQCLQRLQTDHIDLMQIHEVIRPDDPERVFAPGGTMEALLAARRAGKIRYIGFTGHKDPGIHL